MRSLFLAAALGSVLASTSAMAVSITNTPDGGQIIYWGPSAFGGGQSYGEVFTAPQARLDDFSFIASGDGFPFVGQVYAWDGTQTVGPALFTSGEYTTTNTLTTYTFIANTTLTVGSQYIAFITNQPGPSGVSLGGSGFGEIESGTGPATFYFAEGNPSAPGAWFSYSGNGAFNADFSLGTPEPATWALMIGGFALVGAGMRRRARTSVAFA